MGLFKRFSKKAEKPCPVEEAEPTREIYTPWLLSYQVANLQMVGARERQEDSFAILNSMDVNAIIREGLFAVVADGMGGMQDGKLVSEAAVADFLELFRGLDREGDIPSQLSDGVREVSGRIYSRFEGAGGTTAVLTLFYEGALYWVSVGDSSLFLRRDGGLFQMNQEHNYRSQLYLSELDREAVDRERVESDPDGVRLSEFVGIDLLEDVDCNFRPFRLRPGDTFLLCSDGISGTVSTGELNAILSLPPEEAALELQNAVIRAGRPNQDNYTGVIVSCCE